MKTIISITIAASVPTLAYLSFTLPSEGMSNIAHTIAWILSLLALLCLLLIGHEEVKKSVSKKPVNKIERFSNRVSYLVASIVFVFYGSIATGIATLFCVFVSFVIASQTKATGE